MSPTVEFPPVMPATCQLMLVLVVPVTVPANCFDWPACTVALVGEMVTLIGAGDGDGLGVGVGVGVGVGLGVGVGDGVGPTTVSDNHFLNTDP